MRQLALTTLCGVLTFGAVGFAPVAQAAMAFGNYDLRVVGRYDFHTWVWSASPCPAACIRINAIAMPVAKAFNYAGDAQLADGRYTLTVDVPDGLRCGDIYYGPTTPTHDVYSWDAATLAGSLQSSYDVGCNNAPAGTNTYPFTVSRM